MGPSNENKVKTSQCKKGNGSNYYKKAVNNSLSNICETNVDFNNSPYSYNRIRNLVYQRRIRLLIKYILCKNGKAWVLNENNYFPDLALELIDKLRNILNTMLEDDEGIYHKGEILDVSRELDDAIYHYYKYEERM